MAYLQAYPIQMICNAFINISLIFYGMIVVYHLYTGNVVGSVDQVN